MQINTLLLPLCVCSGKLYLTLWLLRQIKRRFLVWWATTFLTKWQSKFPRKLKTTYILLSKNLKSSELSSEFISTINSASLLPGNSDSPVEVLKVTQRNSWRRVGPCCSLNRCWTSPLHGFHLHWRHSQQLCYVSVSLSAEFSVVKRLQTGC